MATPSPAPSEHAISDGEDEWLTDPDENLSFARGDATPQLQPRVSMITLALLCKHQSPQPGQPAPTSTAISTDDALIVGDIATATATSTATATTTMVARDRPHHGTNSTNRSTNNDHVRESYAPVLDPKETRTRMLCTELAKELRENLYKGRTMHHPVLIKNAQGVPMQPARHQGPSCHTKTTTTSTTNIEFAPRTYHTRGW